MFNKNIRIVKSFCNKDKDAINGTICMSHIIIWNVQQFTAKKTKKTKHYSNQTLTIIYMNCMTEHKPNVFKEILNWHRLQD